MNLRYDSIEAQIADEVPELRRAAQGYWQLEGHQGHDAGPYIFVGDLFKCFVEVLLAMRPSPGRDRLLKGAFAFVDRMLSSDDSNVHDLAFIEFLENEDPWWLGRGKPFFGPKAVDRLQRHNLGWREDLDTPTAADTEREIIDLYGVRDVILKELETEQVRDRDVPGISAPSKWKALPSLEAARELPGTVAFISCYGTSQPLVIAPISVVRCDTTTLRRLAADLANYAEPGQSSKAEVHFVPIREGERVWQMSNSTVPTHARWQGALWIAPRLKGLGYEQQILEVLAGSRPR